MFKNYIKIAFRNLLKHRVHSIINILGLSIGIAISILILILVQEELSYDKYNENWKRISRVNQRQVIDGNLLDGALTPLALNNAILEDITGVEEAVRLLQGSHKLVSYGDAHFSADRFFYADGSFFRIFSIPMLKGDPATALDDNFTLVLTESMAQRYFGEDDPLGKELSLDNGWNFTITGVCADVPENSHFHFDYLASLQGVLKGYEEKSWQLPMVATYILARDEDNSREIESHFPEMIQKYIFSKTDKLIGEIDKDIVVGDEFEFYLQGISEIHMNARDSGEFEAGTDKVYIFVFTFIALLILVIACVNFMNLATAKSAARAKEVALRKIVGASRRQMMYQFLSESLLYSFVALLLSVVVLELMMRPFNNYSGKNLDIFYLDSWYLIPGFILGTLIIGLLAGSYPAFYLSAFREINILKGRNFRGMKSTRLRGYLVLSQFTATIILFISSMILYQQVKYFRQSNLGFNQNNIVVIQRAYALQDRKEDFKDLLVEHPRIHSASVSMALPGTPTEHYPFHIDSLGKDQVVYFRPMPADYDFLPTMQMHLIEGDFYSADDSTCYNSILINEAAARKLDVENPIGMKLMGMGMLGEEMEYTIQGIVKDYHFESLHHEIKPLAITLLHEKSHAQYLSVRISGEEIPESIEYIEKTWRKFANDEPFDSYFLNEDLNSMYEQEETTANIFSIFTFLALFTASLGLFGLASHTSEQKTREIGIRKAMGATIPKITLMLSSQSAKWVIWANLIAFPVVYIGMKLWLGKFAYHINIEGWLFFLAAFLALAIALVTVIYQAIRSARANPVEALQYE